MWGWSPILPQSPLLGQQPTAKGLYPNQPPQLLGPVPERQASQISGFENQQSCCIPKTKGMYRTEKLLRLKGLAGTHLPQGPAQRQSLKAPRFYVKEIHLLILERRLEGQGPVWILSEMGAGGCRFPLFLCLAKARGHYLSFPPLPWRWWSSCIPSADLQSTGISGGELLFAAGTLPFASGVLVFVAVARRHSLIAWLRVGGGRACIPGSHEAVTTGETVLGRLPSPRYCPGSRLKTPPASFWERGSFACPGALAWGDGFCSGALLKAYGVLSGNGGW